jgi:2-iminoacetate synthase
MFAERLTQWPASRVEDLIAQCGAHDVARVLERPARSEGDLAALLSPAAVPFLDHLAGRARALTRQRFGHVMQMYAPLYLSNECSNRCTYCGFSQQLSIARKTLSIDEIEREAKHLRQLGFRHVLLVSGEFASIVHGDYVQAAVRAIRPFFSSISIEVAPFPAQTYAQWIDAGVDGITLYQETYDRPAYQSVHVAGPKKHFDKRLVTMDDAGRAGFRTLGIGVLLGLAPALRDLFWLGLHARHLAHTHWRSRIAISFPRIRPMAGSFATPFEVTDTQLLQAICAMRLWMPDAELVLSTRESPALRDALAPIAITKMSACSATSPGGYSVATASGEQFAVEDRRSIVQVQSALAAAGLESVFKDFDASFLQPMGGA